ncbi:speriolin-like isoform 2-T2 [Anomaloglossus baeobatrachus]|uniref:speriolin-like isoform X2 n=1 Tax=Anomaloglossus baeobatrachus TaxID=238106 RepID=UPI003F50C5A8
MENTNIYSCDEEAFNMESSRLLAENAQLRKMMGLMQENVELRCVLKDHERKAQIITPPGQHKKDHNDLKEEAKMVNSGTQIDPEKVKKCQRIVGEIAFQLDRRILCAIFLEQQRLYGYRVPYIKEKIIEVTTSPTTGKVDEKLRSELYQRYNHIMDELRKLGYNPAVHPHFTEYMVNTYGITKDRNARTKDLSSYNDPQYLNKMITECMSSDIVKDIIIILNCLVYFAREDGKSLLISPLSSHSSL